jgi:hypothetical protein
MSAIRKLTSSEVENIIQTNENGEIINETTTIKTNLKLVEKEPAYIKLYLDDLTLLKQLSKMENLILHEIFKITQYNTNIVILNKFYRENICNSLDIKDQTVRNAISKFAKLDLLLKEATGVYRLNPFYFATGDWASIKGLRMTIEYTQQGRRVQINSINDSEVACTK